MKISFLQILDRNESGEQVLILNFNEHNKKAEFGSIPYSTIRMASSYSFIFPDTPFGKQHVYKAHSIKNIIDLNKIKVNKKIFLPEWPSRNKSCGVRGGGGVSTFIKNDSCGSLGQTKSMTKLKNDDYKKNRLYFNKTMMADWTPKTISKKEDSNYTVNNEIRKKEIKRKLKDFHNKILKTLIPKDEKRKIGSNNVYYSQVNEFLNQNTKKNTKKSIDNQLSIFSEQKSIDEDLLDYNQANDDFFSILSYEQELKLFISKLKDYNINQLDDSDTDRKRIREIINSFFEITNIYKKSNEILLEKNRYYKTLLESIHKKLEMIASITEDYKLISNKLSNACVSTSLSDHRENCLCSIERSLIKELKLVKFFRLEYDQEKQEDNERNLLFDIISNITVSSGFNKLNKKKKERFVSKFKILNS